MDLPDKFMQNSIAYAYRDGTKKTVVTTMDGSATTLGLPLKKVLKYFNPTDYHVLSKNFIVHVDAITCLKNSDEALIITLQPAFEKQLLVSPEHVNSFRNWMYLHYK